MLAETYELRTCFFANIQLFHEKVKAIAKGVLVMKIGLQISFK